MFETARCPQGIGLVAFDLDGTVVPHGGKISERVLAALDEVHRAGALLVVASGRPLDMIPAQVAMLAPDYFVTINGAAVYTGARELVATRPIPLERARELMDILAPLKPYWSGCWDKRAYFEPGSIFYTDAAGGRLKHVLSLGARIALGKALGASIVGSVRRAMESRALPVEKLSCSFKSQAAHDQALRIVRELEFFSAAAMDEGSIEITAKGADKGWGLEQVAKVSGVDPARMVAFGDNGNDLAMGRVAGRFVAMAHGSAEARANASELCPSIEEDGVAVWLEAHAADVVPVGLASAVVRSSAGARSFGHEE